MDNQLNLPRNLIEKILIYFCKCIKNFNSHQRIINSVLGLVCKDWYLVVNYIKERFNKEYFINSISTSQEFQSFSHYKVPRSFLNLELNLNSETIEHYKNDNKFDKSISYLMINDLESLISSNCRIRPMQNLKTIEYTIDCQSELQQHQLQEIFQESGAIAKNLDSLLVRVSSMPCSENLIKISDIPFLEESSQSLKSFSIHGNNSGESHFFVLGLDLFSHFQSLMSFTIVDSIIQSGSLVSLIQNCLNLEILYCDGIFQDKGGADNLLRNGISLSISLKTVGLYSVDPLLSLESLVMCLNKNSILRELSIFSDTDLTFNINSLVATDIPWLKIQNTTLTDLTISIPDRLISSFIFTLWSNSSSLVNLKLDSLIFSCGGVLNHNHCKSLDLNIHIDQDLSIIPMKSLPNLKSLKISNSNIIPGSAGRGTANMMLGDTGKTSLMNAISLNHQCNSVNNLVEFESQIFIRFNDLCEILKMNLLEKISTSCNGWDSNEITREIIESTKIKSITLQPIISEKRENLIEYFQKLCKIINQNHNIKDLYIEAPIGNQLLLPREIIQKFKQTIHKNYLNLSSILFGNQNIPLEIIEYLNDHLILTS